MPEPAVPMASGAGEADIFVWSTESLPPNSASGRRYLTPRGKPIPYPFRQSFAPWVCIVLSVISVTEDVGKGAGIVCPSPVTL